MNLVSLPSPKVSVCIPSYNHAAYIRECIQSVLSQNFQDLELVIVDDMSSDNTCEVVEEIQDARVRFFRNKQNMGAAATGLRAFRLTRGAYIHPLASDDVMLPGNLERKAALLDAHPEIGLVYSDVWLIDANGKKMATYWASEGYFPVRGRLNAALVSSAGTIVPAIAVMFRRVVTERLGYMNPDIKYAQDGDFWLRVAGEFDLEYINEPLVAWRQHTTNLHGRGDPQEYLDRVQVISNITERYPNVVSRRTRQILLANCTAQAGLTLAQTKPHLARRYFRDALQLCPYHLPAWIWYLNSFVNIQPLWNLMPYKKLLMHWMRSR